jgi:hypothetical protein
MSAASDRFEKAIMDAINTIPGMKADRPPAATQLSDVAIVEHNNSKLSNRVWVEVKMNHTDNLANPRVFYKDKKWQTTYETPAAQEAVKMLNASLDAAKFITAISKFSGIPEDVIKIPTTISGLKESGAVPLHIMKSYFSQPGVNRYIHNKENYPIGDLVTKHYTLGKKEPAYYMQADDDFYMISNKNPLKVPSGVKMLSGTGDFKVRVSTRSQFYEVQAEIKIKSMPNSEYSVKSGTIKKNPFE